MNKHTRLPFKVGKDQSDKTSIYASGFRIAVCNSGEVVRDKANALYLVNAGNYHERLITKLRSMVVQFDAEECNNSATDWAVIDEAKDLLAELESTLIND